MGALTNHIVRRGIEHVHQHFTKEQYVAKLQQDAQAYDNAGPEMKMKPQEFIPVAITVIVAALLLASVNYTVGSLMSTLAMIESPSRTAIIDSKQAPPPYTDEADAPLEKEPLMATEPETETDIEVTIIDQKPITSKLRATIGHLHRIGGFRARWRGAGVSVVYHLLHSVLANILIAGFGLGFVGHAFAHIFVSVGLARVHMAWTHRMIAYPSSKPWYRSIPARKDCRAILLPSLVYAVAQQATILIPVGIAIALSGEGPMQAHDGMPRHKDCAKYVMIAVRLLAIPTAYIALALGFLLPAAATLARVEATLLPEGEETIVPFDKAALIGDIDVSARGGSKALFKQAWKSVDGSVKLRVIKLFVKLVLMQIAIVFVAAHLVVAELYVVSGDRLAVFAKSARAQLQLMQIEAHEAKGN